MEWYINEIMRVNPHDASVFGAIQLILLAAVWVFRIGFPKPVRKK